MAKIVNPVLFSDYFKIDAEDLHAEGAFDPTLNVDTKLFIDPLLLAKSSHEIIQKDAVDSFNNYFEDIIVLLKASKNPGDLPWREADRRMDFKEISATCLGYGAATIRGSALGKTLRRKLLETAQTIISHGVENPRLFILLPLIEQDISADRISDMTTKIISRQLAAFTEKVARNLSIPTTSFLFNDSTYQLPKNPLERRETPVILVPEDILSELPAATDWSEIADSCSKSLEL